MGLFSGLVRPPRSGVDGFLAALRHKLERDRLLAAQAVVQNDSAEAMHIRERSRAMDARRAEAKERARRQQMFDQERRHVLELEFEESTPKDESGNGAAEFPSGFAGGPAPGHSVSGQRGWDPVVAERLEADRIAAGPAGAGIQSAAFQAGFPAFPAPLPRPGPGVRSQGGAVGRALVDATVASGAKPRIQVQDTAPVPPAWRTGGRWNASDIAPRAARAMRLYDIHVARGMTPQEAAGWAANADAESNSDYRQQQPGGPGYGLFQWERDRQRHFQEAFGHPIQRATEDEQLTFRDHELRNREIGAARRLARVKSAGDYAAAITNYYERPNPADRPRDAADRANLAEAILANARARDRRRRRQ